VKELVHRALLLTLAALVTGCATSPKADKFPDPAPPPKIVPAKLVDVPSDASTALPVACLSPWDETSSDDRDRRKPIDPARLAEVERSTLDPAQRAYGRALLQFEAHHWVEAGVALRALAFEHARDDLGGYASQLYLECLNIVGTRAHRAQCYEEMARDVPQLLGLHCGLRRKSNEEPCRVLDAVHLEVEQLQARRAFQDAETSGDPSGYRVSAAKYLELVRRLCIPKATTDHCDELAYNAALAFLAADDLGGAAGIRALMVDPKNGMEKSQLLKRLACRLDGPTSPACR
jgi:hypothetical protein